MPGCEARPADAQARGDHPATALASAVTPDPPSPCHSASHRAHVYIPWEVVVARPDQPGVSPSAGGWC